MTLGSRLPRTAASIVAAGSFALLSPSAHAAGANLDRSLGGDGTVATSFDLEVTDAALDQRGRVVLGGIRNGQPAVARLLKDGTPDPAFGGDGIVHEGSVNGTLNVDLELLPDSSIRALVLTEAGPDKYLRVDFDPSGAQTWARYFEGSAGSADLTADGGAVATRLDSQLSTVRYEPSGAQDSSFQPGGEPTSYCVPMAGCHYYYPDELAVGRNGVVVQSIDSFHTNSSCDGSRAIYSLAEGETRLKQVAHVSGCGVNEVYSIAEAPDGSFLVSAWGAPEPTATFIRIKSSGELDPSFGDDGIADTPAGRDNFLISDPAFGPSGAFFNSMTEPREPTLRLRPSRFDAAGRLDKGFASRTPNAEFDSADGIQDFDPVATLRSDSRRITVVGTGQSASGPVPALARWRPSKKR